MEQVRRPGFLPGPEESLRLSQTRPVLWQGFTERLLSTSSSQDWKDTGNRLPKQERDELLWNHQPHRGGEELTTQ